MKLAWLLPDQPCDRHQFGDAAAGLWSLRHQGYAVAPTLLVSVHWWQLYGATLAAVPIAELAPGDPSTIAPLQQVFRRVVIPPAWLDALATACRNLPGAAVVLHPSLVTHDKLPWVVQDLWRSQTSLKTPDALAAALTRLGQQIIHPQSLYCYQQYQLTWSELQIALRVQPLTPAIASGQLIQTPQSARLEAIWGLGYRWLTDAIAPDYYSRNFEPHHGQPPNGELEKIWRPQHRGSKHQTWSVTPQGQLQCWPTTETQQNQWVFSTQDIQQHWTRFVHHHSSAGRLLWQCPTPAQLEVTHWQPPASLSPSLDSEVAVTEERGWERSNRAVNLAAHLIGQGVVPGSVLAAPVVVTPQTQHLPPENILVATTLPPHQIALLGEAVGLILEQGTATSHAVIVARELRIPTVIGVTGAIAQLKRAQTVWLDADQGRVYLPAQPSPPVAVDPPVPVVMPEAPPAFPTPVPKTNLPLWGTINHPQILPSLPDQSLDGIGLIRAELLLMGLHPDWTQLGQPPSPQQIQAQLEQVLLDIAAILSPRPLFYRFADWRIAEFPALPGSPLPAVAGVLGYRGLSAAQGNPWLFDLELAALRTVLAQYPDLSVIFPFVRRLSEWVWARDRLRTQGVEPGQAWIMAETPAIAFEISAYADAGAQGVAIGLNDLTQLTLGIDREVQGLAQVDDWMHPAVQTLVGQISQQATQAGLPCSLCANLDWQQSAIQPLIQQWLDAGLTALVTELPSLTAARQAIAEAEAA
ncbi:MAG: putative PEP-binding protein [Cyanobacteria bacterium P01_G01_bin.54]